MQRTSRAASLAEIADALTHGDIAKAQSLATRQFPWERSTAARKGITTVRALRIFIRNRFIDRYSGSRLIFPGALLAIGKLLPDHFPMHPTWKAGESYHVFWELWPVIDHVRPVTRGGAHDESNFVTTSTNNNVAKGNALVSELEWTLLPEPGPEETWDGLVSWYREIVRLHTDLLSFGQIQSWNSALATVDRTG